MLYGMWLWKRTHYYSSDKWCWLKKNCLLKLYQWRIWTLSITLQSSWRSWIRWNIWYNQSEIQEKRSNESLLQKSSVRDTKWNVPATDNSHAHIFKYSPFHDADSQDHDRFSVNTYSSKHSYNNLRTCWTSWFVLSRQGLEISRVHT